MTAEYRTSASTVVEDFDAALVFVEAPAPSPPRWIRADPDDTTTWPEDGAEILAVVTAPGHAPRRGAARVYRRSEGQSWMVLYGHEHGAWPQRLQRLAPPLDAVVGDRGSAVSGVGEDPA